MKKRTVFAFSGMLILMMGIMIRVFELASEGLSQAADQQSSVTVTVANARATIYDRNMQPLVNRRSEYRVSVAAFPEAVAAIAPYLDDQAMTALTERLQSNRPAVVTLDEAAAPAEGLKVFQVPRRYSGSLLSPHLMGYLDGDDLHGVTGIEKIFDEYLIEHGGKATVTYKVDASGRPLRGEKTEVVNTLDEAKAGVVLTLDEDIQRLVESVAKKYITRGAVVVMEPKTGAILSMASLPSYQPDTVADQLDREDSPLLNRALCNYNLGSVFKIVSAATALEKNLPLSTSYNCDGSVNISGVTFHCHNRLGHGSMNMITGFAQSCNPYFIQLMQGAGGNALYTMASLMGFDRSIILAEGLKTARAVLPSLDELQSPATLANLSFGQGTLLATPVHIAQMVSAVVNDGKIQRPTILKGYADKDGNITEEALSPVQTAFSKKTAETLRQLMVEVVENGTGNTAKPEFGGAGGKTGTAETGWKSENGKPVVQSWFAGYYPAEDPKYVIAVLAEDSNGTGGKSSPVFKEICDGIYLLEQAQAAKKGANAES